LPPAVIGPLILARLQEKIALAASHRADVGHLAIGRNQFARLHGRTQIFGSFFQIVRSLGAVGEFLWSSVAAKSRRAGS